MPRITYIKAYPPPKDVLPPNMLRELFKRYMAAGNVTSPELGRRLGKTGESVRAKLHAGSWTAQEIGDWCRALGIVDPAEVGKAILY